MSDSKTSDTHFRRPAKSFLRCRISAHQGGSAGSKVSLKCPSTLIGEGYHCRTVHEGSQDLRRGSSSDPGDITAQSARVIFNFIAAASCIVCVGLSAFMASRPTQEKRNGYKLYVLPGQQLNS